MKIPYLLALSLVPALNAHADEKTEAAQATSSSPQYIIKDVQISFEDGDEPLPELHPVKPAHKVATPKKKAKTQTAAPAKAGKAPSTSKAPAEHGPAVK